MAQSRAMVWSIDKYSRLYPGSDWEHLPRKDISLRIDPEPAGKPGGPAAESALVNSQPLLSIGYCEAGPDRRPRVHLLEQLDIGPVNVKAARIKAILKPPNIGLRYASNPSGGAPDKTDCGVRKVQLRFRTLAECGSCVQQLRRYLPCQDHVPSAVPATPPLLPPPVSSLLWSQNAWGSGDRGTAPVSTSRGPGSQAIGSPALLNYADGQAELQFTFPSLPKPLPSEDCCRGAPVSTSSLAGGNCPSAPLYASSVETNSIAEGRGMYGAEDTGFSNPTWKLVGSTAGGHLQASPPRGYAVPSKGVSPSGAPSLRGLPEGNTLPPSGLLWSPHLSTTVTTGADATAPIPPDNLPPSPPPGARAPPMITTIPLPAAHDTTSGAVVPVAQGSFSRSIDDLTPLDLEALIIRALADRRFLELVKKVESVWDAILARAP